MDYFDAVKATVTKEEARREILKHQLSFKDFLVEIGNKSFYKGKEVLDWLGY